MKSLLTSIFGFHIFITPLHAQTFTTQQKNDECEKVKSACRHAWSGYKKYAWGYDALKPISNQGENWYATSLVMTPMNAYDTLFFWA